MKPVGLACLFLHFMLLHFCSNNTLETDEESDFHSDPQLLPLNLGHSSCGFKADGGACKASIERFYFNILTRQCEAFEYGGCGGNDNNFETVEECKAKCIVNDAPKKRRGKFKYQKPEFCLLEDDPGICRGLISRYFYSKDSGKCEIFKYGGCFGNANNFRALEDCQITCQDHLTPISDGQTQTPETPNDSLPFQMPTASQRTGRFRGPSLCQNLVDKGNCSATVKRFYYNHVARKCMPFLYTGCGGNENNFTSRKSCLKVCKKDSVKSRRKKKKQSFKQSSDPLTSALA